MIKLPGIPQSYWEETSEKTNFPSLSKGLSVDVAILGGGIVGLTAAILLAEAGKKVAVLESRRIVAGVTGYTTAKITSLHDIIYRYLIDNFGKEKAFLYGDAQEKTLKFIASFVKERNINCDFVRAPAYTYTQKEEYLEDIEKEFEAAKSLGLPASFVTNSELPFKIKGAVSFTDQAHFHPRKYLLTIAKLIIQNGSYVFENTRALDVQNDNPKEVITDKRKILAKDVIVATHYPIVNKGKPYVSRLVPKRSYVLAVKIKESVPKGMYISLEKPFFSIRPQPSGKGDILIVTGDEHKTGIERNTAGCYLELEKKLREKFRAESIDYHWSTQDNYTIDRVPYIGKYDSKSKHLYTATGFGGWGMTNGTLAGMILSDMILGKANSYASFFDLEGRSSLKSAKNFVKTNINNAKEFVKGRFIKRYESYNKY